MLREAERYGLETSLVRDATGRAQLRTTMRDDAETRALAATAAEVRALRPSLDAGLRSASQTRVLLASTEHAHQLERLAWTHPVLVTVVEHPGAIAVVAAGPSSAAARVLADAIAQRRAAIAHARAALSADRARAWALVEVVEAELDARAEGGRGWASGSGSGEPRALTVSRARGVARTPEGAALVEAWARAGATLR